MTFEKMLENHAGIMRGFSVCGYEEIDNKGEDINDGRWSGRWQGGGSGAYIEGLTLYREKTMCFLRSEKSI